MIRKHLITIKGKFYSSYTRTAIQNSTEMRHSLIKTKVSILKNQNTDDIDRVIQMLENDKPYINNTMSSLILKESRQYNISGYKKKNNNIRIQTGNQVIKFKNIYS